MNAAPILSVTRNGEPLLKADVDTQPVQHQRTIDVNELQPYGFEVEHRELDTEYGLWVGDIETGRAIRADQLPASTIGIARGRLVIWDDAAYFEGARGLVWVRLCSRSATGEHTWRERISVPIIVASGKLSAERYATMLEQLSGLAAGLVLDLVSKTLRSTRLSLMPSEAQIRTSAVELRILESVWPVVAANLHQIAQAPERRLQRRFATTNCWGSERLDPGTIATLVRNGIDPRLQFTSLPFRAQVGRIQESLDTTEHRVIRGFVDLLHQRACECRTNLVRHIESLELDRKWRDRPSLVGSSLYVSEDVPRLQRLQDRLRRAHDLIVQLKRARRMEVLAKVHPTIDLTPTPVFSNVEPYRRIRHEMLKFLKTGLIIVEEGADERIKSTSRLYEQWVFLQLAAAFRQSGLTCSSQQGILHSSRMFRFTLDLDRGARVTFSSRDGRAVILRYEPWVMPRSSAVQNRDTVYRGREGESAWSPDVLVEFISGPELVGEPATVEYAVVIDAKYTRGIREHHWNDTTKYLEIRATATGRQIARQQWLVFPGDDNQLDQKIVLRDSSIRWTENGPNSPRDENLQGTLALAPSRSFDSSGIAGGWITKPEQAATSFVSGLLRFMNFEIVSNSEDAQ
jgi:hypothetical protein